MRLSSQFFIGAVAVAVATCPMMTLAAPASHQRRAGLQCDSTAKDGATLSSSSISGGFTNCLYPVAGECTYFTPNGEFSSGSSNCPASLVQGSASPPPSSSSSSSTSESSSTTEPAESRTTVQITIQSSATSSSSTSIAVATTPSSSNPAVIVSPNTASSVGTPSSTTNPTSSNSPTASPTNSASNAVHAFLSTRTPLVAAMAFVFGVFLF